MSAMMNRSIDVEQVSTTVSGDVNETWSSLESDVRGEMIFAGARDNDEEGVGLNVERRRYKIMKSGRTFNPDTTRFRETGETLWFMTTGFTPYRGSKEVYVLEGIKRSNQ